MLLNPQFLAEQVLNSLQFSMLLFLLAIGLSVVFGLMDYLNLSHGTIYMFAAYVAFSITQLGGSFWIALALAPCAAALVGMLLYVLLLKRAERTGHLTQVLLTVGVIYIGIELIRIAYGDLPKGVCDHGPIDVHGRCELNLSQPLLLARRHHALPQLFPRLSHLRCENSTSKVPGPGYRKSAKTWVSLSNALLPCTP